MFWIYLLIGLLVIAAVLLVLVVLIQNSKGGGLVSSSQGAAVATQLFGARRGADFVEKATWTLMGSLVVLTFLINIAFSTVQQPAAKSEGIQLDESVAAPVPQAPTAIPSLEQLQQQQPAPAGTGTATPAQPDSASQR